ncbi:hypothetical protein JCM21900_001437 [Sporobolomyces salmonicolor]
MSLHVSGDPNFPANLAIKPSTRAVIRGSLVGTADRGFGSRDGDDQDAAQDIETYGIAGRTWEAAYLLRLYLQPPSPSPSPASPLYDPPCPLFLPPSSSSPSSPSSSALVSKRTILEIGSGTGYTSLSLAPHLSSRDTLVLTDLENVCPLLEKNLGTARERWRRRTGPPEEKEEPRVLVRPLPWGAPSFLSLLSAEGLLTDFILASDLVYFPFLYPPLLRTLLGLTEPREGGRAPTVVWSYKIRSLVREQPFWEAFGRWFAFEAVQVGTLDRARESSPEATGTAAPPAPTRAGESREEKEPRPSRTWTRFGAAVPSQSSSSSPSMSSPDETDELYIFLCHRRPSTYGAYSRLGLDSEGGEGVSDEDLMLGRNGAEGEGEGSGRFEEMLMGGLEWD